MDRSDEVQDGSIKWVIISRHILPQRRIKDLTTGGSHWSHGDPQGVKLSGELYPAGLMELVEATRHELFSERF